MKKNFPLILVLISIVFIACKSKQKKNEFVSVLSYIQSQVKHVDTSLYSIVKAEKMANDSTWDTTYVRREDFRGLAKDFLEIPDITDPSMGKQYKEDKMYDDQLGRVIIVYTPIKEGLEIIREELIVAAGDEAFDKMKSVIIDKVKDYKDSSVEQRLLWQTDEKFQVVTIIEKNGQPVSTKTMEVTWNPKEDFVQQPTSTEPDTSSARLKSRLRIDSLRRAREKNGQ